MLIEGAGSAAEVNLRAARHRQHGLRPRPAGTPVVLIGDIDRGGVIAQLVGTKAVIAPEDADMIVGFLVNKFRGDASLFDDGMRFIAERTGWRALGLVPFFAAARIACPPRTRWFSTPRATTKRGRRHDRRADAVAHRQFRRFRSAAARARRAARHGPAGRAAADRRSRHSARHEGDDRRPRVLFAPRAGTSISSPMSGAAGGSLGICGGYQMLGRAIADPQGLEGPAGEVQGLGLIDVETVLAGEKALRAVAGTCLANGAPFSGYEMHVGRTRGPDCARPLLRFADGREDGAISPRRARHGRLCARPVRRRRPARRLARRARRRVRSFLRGDGGAHARRTRRSISRRHVDLDALLALAR